MKNLHQDPGKINAKHSGQAHHINGSAAGGTAARNGKANANDRHGYVFENLPHALRDLLHWGVWQRTYQNGKTQHIPFDAKTGKNLSVSDPAKWSPYEVARETYCRGLRGQWDGVSFVLKELGGIVGLDIDDCLDEHGDLTPEAQDIVNLWGSYVEYSPSRRGIRGFAYGTLPAGRRKVGSNEIYDGAKALTVTGWHVQGQPKTLEERSAAIADIHKKYFTKAKKQHAKGTYDPEDYEALDDEEVIDAALRAKNGARVQALIDGDLSGYASASEADLAACNYLAFYCGPNSHEQIDRIFRERFAGFRPEKWDTRHYGTGETYGQHTIKMALEDRTDFYTRPRQQRGPQTQDPGTSNHTAEEVSRPAAWSFTDAGNAERLVAQHGKDLRYIYSWDKWLVWDGRRWAIDTTGEVMRRAKKTARAIATDEARQVSDDDKRFKDLLAWSRQSLNDAKLKAMIAQARSEPQMAITPDDLDSDPWLFTVLNGTVDLRSGDLLPHARQHFITKLAPITHNPTAECPTWNKFLSRVTGDDKDIIDYLQKGIGYSLTGSTGEECLFFLHGAGRNGKTKLLETIGAVMGDYGQPTEFSTFLHKDHDAVRNDVADLRGARFVTATEVNEGRRLNEALIKNMTGGDRIRARFLFSEHFTFIPEFKLWMAANSKPIVRGTDAAIWERIKLIPFTVTIPEEERDKHLLDKLKAELDGIFLWALHGCYQWRMEGLAMPAKIHEATKAYRNQMDVIGAFIEERCLVESTAQVATGALFEAYQEWCKRSGEDALSKKAFGMRLEERGFIPARTSFGRLWKGLKLILTDENRNL